MPTSVVAQGLVHKLGAHALRLAGTCVKWGVLLHCSFEYLGDFVICSGPSMEPSIRDHDILLTEHISPRMGRLQRGDIIIARSPSHPTQFICKRLVALPGDHLLQTDGNLKHVPKGHVWIEGDNSPNSTDSRMYGPIPVGLVRGRALLRLWPLFDAKILLPS